MHFKRRLLDEPTANLWFIQVLGEPLVYPGSGSTGDTGQQDANMARPPAGRFCIMRLVAASLPWCS